LILGANHDDANPWLVSLFFFSRTHGGFMLLHVHSAKQIALVVVLVLSFGFANTSHAQSPTLKQAYKNDFLIGVALGGNVPDDYTAAELAVIVAHFNAVTPENCMKPIALQPGEGRWEFAQADAVGPGQRLVHFWP
jgi:hypothetical protein